MKLSGSIYFIQIQDKNKQDLVTLEFRCFPVGPATELWIDYMHEPAT